MSLGKELLQQRAKLIEAERKLNEQHEREVKSQWNEIEYAIQNTSITKDTKYIDLGYFPNIFKENIMKLHNEDFTVFQDKSKSIRLYFSEDDYKKDIEGLNIGNTINSDKKSDFKINNNRQVEEDKKAETLKAECEKDSLSELMENLARGLGLESTIRFY